LEDFEWFSASEMTDRSLTNADVGTRRYGGLDVVNMSTVGIQAGMIMAASYLTDDSNSLVLEPKTNWTQKMIACASATRASIKTVEFTANGTRLEDVRVLSVSSKIYPDEDSMPLWAIERTNLSITKFSPLWGLIDDEYEDSEALYTRRKEHLWLPAGQVSDSGQAMLIYDSTPAAAHILALSAAYDIGNSLALGPGLADYSAENDFGLYIRWRDLSRSSETAGKIINLIWTDIMANLVVGTKLGPFSSDKALDGSLPDLVIRPYKRRVVYDLHYAIPAIVLLSLWLCVLSGALLLTFVSRASLSALTQLANQLAPGRMATNFLNSELSRSDARTMEWATRAGSLIIGFERGKNGQGHDNDVTDTLQSHQAEKAGGVNGEDDLTLVAISSADGDRTTVPVSVVLRRRRQAPKSRKKDDVQSPPLHQKGGPQSTTFIAETVLSN
jgi:hypothetical protein